MHERIDCINIDKKTNGSVYWGETSATVTAAHIHRLTCSLCRLSLACDSLGLQNISGALWSQ